MREGGAEQRKEDRGKETRGRRVKRRRGENGGNCKEMAELKNLRFEINNRDEEKKSIKSSRRTEVGGEEERCQREAKVAKPGGVKKGGMKEAEMELGPDTGSDPLIRSDCSSAAGNIRQQRCCLQGPPESRN